MAIDKLPPQPVEPQLPPVSPYRVAASRELMDQRLANPLDLARASLLAKREASLGEDEQELAGLRDSIALLADENGGPRYDTLAVRTDSESSERETPQPTELIGKVEFRGDRLRPDVKLALESAFREYEIIALAPGQLPLNIVVDTRITYTDRSQRNSFDSSQYQNQNNRGRNRNNWRVTWRSDVRTRDYTVAVMVIIKRGGAQPIFEEGAGSADKTVVESRSTEVNGQWTQERTPAEQALYEPQWNALEAAVRSAVGKVAPQLNPQAIQRPQSVQTPATRTPYSSAPQRPDFQPQERRKQEGEEPSYRLSGDAQTNANAWYELGKEAKIKINGQVRGKVVGKKYDGTFFIEFDESVRFDGKRPIDIVIDAPK